MGVKLREINSDNKIATAKVTANSRNKRPITSLMNSNGISTATNDNVRETNVKAICCAPLRDACKGCIPCSIWRAIFSIMTMASSTTKPVAMVRAIKVRLLTLKPNAYIREKVAISDSCTTTVGINVAVKVGKKVKFTTTTKKMAKPNSICTWTATFIPSVVVPLSLMGTFALMYALGFSVNNLTLMALTIATGFVVDDAIVMIENIARHIEQGMQPLQASLKGAQQIAFTLVSLTLSLVAVLIPLLFMSDVIGRLFREFAVTLAVAILLSLLISLSLTPMMCARLLRAPRASTPPAAGSGSEASSAVGPTEGTQTTPADERADDEGPRFGRWYIALAERVLDRVYLFYERSLGWVLKHQKLTLLLTLATLLLTAGMYWVVPKGFFPQQDAGLVQVITQGPQSASFSTMQRLQQKAAEQIMQDEDVAAVTSFVGVDGSNATLNTGHMQVVLKPFGERQQTAAEVAKRIGANFDLDPELQIFLQPIQELTVDDQISRLPFQLAVSDPDHRDLQRWLPEWLEVLEGLPELEEVTSNMQDKGHQLLLNIDRDTAARLGISKSTIDEALYDAYGQRLISTIYTQSAQYRVVLEVAPEYRQQVDDLELLYVPGRDGGLVPLSVLVEPELLPMSLSVERLDQFPAAHVSFSLAPGVSLSEAVEAIEGSLIEADMPGSSELHLLGAAHAFEASLSTSLWLLLAAVLTM